MLVDELKPACRGFPRSTSPGPPFPPAVFKASLTAACLLLAMLFLLTVADPNTFSRFTTRFRFRKSGGAGNYQDKDQTT
jgi:hypothetical protein